MPKDEQEKENFIRISANGVYGTMRSMSYGNHPA